MAENEIESLEFDDEIRELDDESMDQVSGGRPAVGMWFVATLDDGSTAKFHSYDEAAAYSKEHGGCDIKTISGYMRKRRHQ